MKNILLDVKQVSKSFPLRQGLFGSGKGRVQAVNRMNLQVFQGETFGLVGESGCGKSTLARTIMRLVTPDEGEIWFEGQNLAGMNFRQLKPIRKDIRMVFQKPFDSLNPRQTVGEIIGAPFRIHCKQMTAPQREKEIQQLMESVGLSPHYAKRHPHEFSGGQRQRIGIARALALHPKMIICDEPVSALDVSIQSQILNLLKDLQQERQLTYLFISHNLSVVKHMADRIAVMYLGTIVELAEAETLYSNPKHPYTQALLSAIPDPMEKDKNNRILLHGDLPNPANPPAGCPFSTRCPHVMEICRLQKPSLLTSSPEHLVACFLHHKGGI